MITRTERVEKELKEELIKYFEMLTKNLPPNFCKKCGNEFPHGPAGCISLINKWYIEDKIKELIKTARSESYYK